MKSKPDQQASKVLEYIGKGEYLVGIPARDLLQDDLIQSGLTVDGLISTGLYRLIDQQPESNQSVKER